MSALDIVVVNRSWNVVKFAARLGASVFPAPWIRVGFSRALCRWSHFAASGAAGNSERPSMGRMINATGWLRASGFGSSTAKFEIDLSTSPASGRVQTEMTMMVEAMATGRATLVTESGRWIAIRPTGRTADGLAFMVLDDLATVARYFS